MTVRRLTEPEQIASIRSRDELDGYRASMVLVGRDWLPGEQEAFLRQQTRIAAQTAKN